jgi:type I restriction enzyme S subunit
MIKAESIYGTLPDQWKMATINELIEERKANLQTGPFGTMLHASAYRPTGIPVVAVQHIGENRLIHTDMPLVDDETYQRLSRYRLQPGDIIFGRKGSVERRALIRTEEHGWLQGSDCIRLRLDPSTVNPTFISYVLGTRAFREWIIQHAHGATMPSLNQEILVRIPLPVPPLQEQHAIAGVLGALDDKIELNRRMNQTLESMAQAVFRQWFVDHDEVERWEIGKLGDIAENIRRSIQPEEIEPEIPYIGLEHMPRGSIALNEWDSASKVVSNKFLFKQNEFLFGKLRPYFHKVGVAPLDGVSSTDILVVAPKEEDYYGVVLGHISSTELINYTTAASTGTKMPRTGWSDIARYEIALPPRERAREFSDFMKPVVQLIRSNIMQARTLASLRDTLLPKLMRGEVRVKDLEGQLP